jgi:hypothetical protein
MSKFMNKLEGEIRDYSAELERYAKHRLPETLLKKPDHIAIKAFDSPRFEELLEEVKREFSVSDKHIVTEVLNDRRIATAFLAGPIAVGSFGEVKLLEIMEPRPEKVGEDKVGLDHFEFLVPNLADAVMHIRRSPIHENDYDVRSNSNHDFIEVRFGEIIKGEHSREFKLTYESLADIVGVQKVNRKAS